MRRLVTTTGCPTIDAELAPYADVVLRAGAEELVLLRYSSRFRCWYACGCQSVNAAAHSSIPDADMYWKRIGYVEDAAFAYAVFERKPLHAYRQWNDFYNDIPRRQSLWLMRD